MVSYLIIVVILFAAVIIGIAYNVSSDFVDIFSPFYHSGLLSQYNDTDSDYGFDILMTVFKYFLVPALLTTGYFAFTMGQKPEQDYKR